MTDIFKVAFDGNTIGFFAAATWCQASKTGANFHRKQTGENVPWEHVTTTWVNPKHYQQAGVPEELYATPSSTDENSSVENDLATA